MDERILAVQRMQDFIEKNLYSVDGYQRAFQKEFNCNPYEYSKNPIPIYLFNPYGVKFRNMEVKKNMEKVKNIFVKMVEKPEKYVKENTSVYVQGVEVNINYAGVIPEGFDIIELPKAKYLMFQGEPFKEEDYCKAIEEVQEAILKYNPNVIGYEWDNENPKIQLEPIGERGYIELHPIK